MEGFFRCQEYAAIILESSIHVSEKHPLDGTRYSTDLPLASCGPPLNLDRIAVDEGLDLTSIIRLL